MWEPLDNSVTVPVGKIHRAKSRLSYQNRIHQICLHLVLLLALSFTPDILAQGGGSHTLYGDLKVDESKVDGPMPISFYLLLYIDGGYLISRQSVPNNGRYRFLNLRNGYYDIVVEVENAEVARIRVFVSSPYKNDFRQDIELEWRPTGVGKSTKAANISVEDNYVRSSSNQKRFDKAQEAADAKRNEEAVKLFRNLLVEDKNDFQAWTELGTAYLAQDNLPEAENAYMQATKLNPRFFLGLLNLGRLRILQKNFDGAIAPLTQAVDVKPTSAAANYYLGETYLQVKKGSKAVTYLTEALKLDPVGRADAHLRLAALYDAVGLKEKAVVEYEGFLKKKPDYADKKKLEQYIAQNKKH